MNERMSVNSIVLVPCRSRILDREGVGSTCSKDHTKRRIGDTLHSSSRFALPFIWQAPFLTCDSVCAHVWRVDQACTYGIQLSLHISCVRCRVHPCVTAHYWQSIFKVLCAPAVFEARSTNQFGQPWALWLGEYKLSSSWEAEPGLCCHTASFPIVSRCIPDDIIKDIFLRKGTTRRAH